MAEAETQQIILPRLNCNHRNILRRAITQERTSAGSYFIVGKGVSNRNHGYSRALQKLSDLSLIEVIQDGDRIVNWRVRLLVCPNALSKLLS